MANFGPLTDEISSGVWGSPANFNGFRILAALLHGTLVVGVPFQAPDDVCWRGGSFLGVTYFEFQERDTFS